MQTVECVGNVVRFRRNKLVEYLLDNGGISMTELAGLPGIPRSDREQFAQLIGYSISGFGDLGYVSKKTIMTADKSASILPSSVKETP